MNKIELLLDRGFVDVCISALKAFELQGAGKVGEANVQGLWCCVSLLSTLDLTAPEAVPIVRLLADMPSTLRFIFDNPLFHVREMGWTTPAQLSAMCALAFGKQEGGACAQISANLLPHRLLAYVSLICCCAVQSCSRRR